MDDPSVTGDFRSFVARHFARDGARLVIRPVPVGGATLNREQADYLVRHLRTLASLLPTLGERLGETPGRSEFNIALGSRIREAREASGWTQRELCRRSGLSPAFLCDLERGKRSVSVDNLVSLANALGREPGWFLRPVDGEAG